MIPNCTAFISPTTITLVAQSVGTFFWGLLAILAVNLLILLKKMKKKKKIVLIIFTIIIVGILLGNLSSKYINARKLNTYDKVNNYSIEEMTYSECIKYNFLSFFSKNTEISVYSTDDMIAFLLKNQTFNILNIGNNVPLRFKNEVYIDQTTGDFNELYEKIKDLDKNIPLFIHCGGRGHTSSMIANLISRKGFKKIIILSTSPEDLALRMNQINLDYKNYFKINEQEKNNPIIRISYSAELEKTDIEDVFLFYKVSNFETYLEDSPYFNELNSKRMYDLDFDYYIENVDNNSKIHFLCDEEIECKLLQSTLAISNIKNKGYLVILYE